MHIDFNCDIGEGIGNDASIMPFISSANIACGYHAGDADSIVQTISLCIKNNIAIGAHPSFLDKENFGRREVNLPIQELYELITQQLFVFKEIADSLGQTIHHVKPHGALYNLSAKDQLTATIIAKAIRDFDSNLILYGLSGSFSISEAKAIGLKTASEVFADRTYQEDGSLTSRSQPNALIEKKDAAIQQVLQMIKEKTVTTLSNKTIPIIADTICIHGDGENAIAFAQSISETMKQHNIAIKAI